MKTNNFLKKFIKELTKTPPRRPVYNYPRPLYHIIILLLLLVLVLLFINAYYKNPIVEGLESDSFWCKYFSWFPGVSCDEPAPAAAAAAATAAATAAASATAATADTADASASTAASGSSDSSSTPESESELPDCNCNTNCVLKNESSDRVLNDECKIPEGLENVTNVNGYCDKCYDIVYTGCRLHGQSNDPIKKADEWCKQEDFWGRPAALKGLMATMVPKVPATISITEGEGVIERCKSRDIKSFPSVPSGHKWKGETFKNAYPKVVIDNIIDSRDFSGEGGKCENNMNPKLRWTRYE